MTSLSADDDLHHWASVSFTDPPEEPSLGTVHPTDHKRNELVSNVLMCLITADVVYV